MDITSKIPVSIPTLAPSQKGGAKVVSNNSPSRFRGNVKESSKKNSLEDSLASTQSFSVSSLDALFFNESDDQEKRRRQIKWGNELLDELEILRVQLISGNVSRDHLSSLSEILKNKQGFIVDPQLEEIIREIETRVAVELAKLGFA